MRSGVPFVAAFGLRFWPAGFFFSEKMTFWDSSCSFFCSSVSGSVASSSRVPQSRSS